MNFDECWKERRITARLALLQDESGNPPVSSQKMTFDVVCCFFFQCARCRGENQKLSLSPHFLHLVPFFSFTLSVCAFSFHSLWLVRAFSSPSSGSCLAYLLPSLCLLPPWHPLAPSSLTLSSTYLWITNDNGLCSLMWEFCNQPRCMVYALMALIFSDFNAPQDHQQQGESTQINSAQNKRVVNLVSNSECEYVNEDVTCEDVMSWRQFQKGRFFFTKMSQAYSG